MQLSAVDHSLLGPNRWPDYLWPYVVIVIPNVALTGAIFFALAALLRRMTPVYAGTVILVIGYLMAGALTTLDNKTLAGLIDPFGSRAVGLVTEFWTVAEKNTLLVPLQGALLGNRLLWMGAAVALLVWTWHRFQFEQSSTPDRARAVRFQQPPYTTSLELLTYNRRGDASRAAVHP